jgi:hypothetical protein
MKIQSAGRLGNTLFIWAYALFISQDDKIKVSIFTDRFHSGVGVDFSETRKLLSETKICFCNSDSSGGLLATIDWASGKSQKLGRALKLIFGVSDEWDPITSRVRIVRGFFQNSDYVLKNKALISEKLLRATYLIEQNSAKIQYLKSRYPQYQVVHIRLGDFVNSEFGVISPESYKSAFDPIIPILICTDGSQEEILEMIDFPVEEILTPAELSTWETLCIMQSASRFVGANSTLSWWGAFLAISRGNLAFLPDQWVKSGNSKDLDLPNLEGCKRYKVHFI